MRGATWRVTYLWEVACAVADQQTRLAAAAIADDDQLLRVRGRLGDVGVARGGGGIGADGAVAVALAGGPDGPASRCDGRNGRLCALLAAQIVVILRGRGRGRHGGGGGGGAEMRRRGRGQLVSIYAGCSSWMRWWERVAGVGI